MQKHSIWAVPSEPALSKLQAFVDLFSQKTGLPTFTPHITILGDIPECVDVIEQHIQEACAHVSELELDIHHAVVGDTFFMSFYAEIKDHERLAPLHNDLSGLFPTANIPQHFTPHISLAYGELSIDIKTQIQKKVQDLLPLSISIDHLQLVKSSNDTPIEDWQCMKTVPLKGSEA